MYDLFYYFENKLYSPTRNSISFTFSISSAGACHHCFSSNLAMVGASNQYFFTSAGTPPTMVEGGTSLVTTASAAMPQRRLFIFSRHLLIQVHILLRNHRNTKSLHRTLSYLITHLAMTVVLQYPLYSMNEVRLSHNLCFRVLIWISTICSFIS